MFSSNYFYAIRHLPKSIYFNFHYFPIKTAIKLPVLFLSSVKLVDTRGVVKLKGPVSTGMVIIGGRGNALYEHASSGCVWANHGGICKFYGRNEFCKGFAVEIGRFASLEFEENTYFGPMVRMACFDQIVIGANSRIAWESIIMDTDFHSTINTETGKRSSLTKPIFIGKNNWIGIRSFVMKGTKTSAFCVFGANGTLNKDYSDSSEYSLFAGQPVKLLKNNIYRDLTSNVLYNWYIVNADDFGLSKSVNEAINEGIINGNLSSTTILANGDAFDDAIRLAKENNYIDKIGLHFNIIEGTPLTDPIKKCSRFCDGEGKLSYKRNSALSLSKQEKQALCIELQAQIDKVLAAGVILSHFDSHEHSHTEWPIFSAIYPTLLKNGIKTVRLSTNCLPVSRLKRIYKKWFNNKLKRLGFITTDYFCEYSELDIIHLKEDEKLIEVMVHPEFTKGGVFDTVTKEKIQYKMLEKLTYKKIIQ